MPHDQTFDNDANTRIDRNLEVGELNAALKMVTEVIFRSPAGNAVKHRCYRVHRGNPRGEAYDKNRDNPDPDGPVVDFHLGVRISKRTTVAQSGGKSV